MDTNVVVLVGRATRDVEVKYLGTGTAVATLGLAVNGRKPKEGEQEQTTFVDVTLWGRTAEIAAEYVQKGKQVVVTGRLRLETWEKDGEKRSKLGVVAENLQLLSGANGGGDTESSSAPAEDAPKRGRPRKADKPANTSVGDDEIPF